MSDVARLRPDDLAALASRLATPWMTAREAAIYLRCPLSRVRKLTMIGELPHEHDGRRVLYHRDRLDQFVQGGGAKSP
jgi:excisionase family DNA binding protein